MSWAPETHTHRFRSGRSAVLYTQTPFGAIARAAVEAGDQDVLDVLIALSRRTSPDDPMPDDRLALLRLQDLIVAAKWARPRVHPGPPEDLGEDISSDDPEVIPLRWVTDEEQAETVELCMGGVRDADTFREEPDGDKPREGGPGVGSKPKRARRASPGKR